MRRLFGGSNEITCVKCLAYCRILSLTLPRTPTIFYKKDKIHTICWDEGRKENGDGSPCFSQHTHAHLFCQGPLLFAEPWLSGDSKVILCISAREITSVLPHFRVLHMPLPHSQILLCHGPSSRNLLQILKDSAYNERLICRSPSPPVLPVLILCQRVPL